MTDAASAPLPRPPVQPLRLDVDAERLTLLDQTLLPNSEQWLEIDSVTTLWEAIHQLRVRGAPAIGIAAAAGLAVAARASGATTAGALLSDVEAASAYLATARPTAVNLFWALERTLAAARAYVAAIGADAPAAALRRHLWQSAQALLDDDLAAGLAIGEHGAALLREGAVLTHCNAGAIATSGWGTALAPIYVAQQRGLALQVYADETRPLLQGARLTAWELARAGIPVTVITDSMAATVLARGEVQAVLVGADRVAANGDVANKIGTFGLAIIARELGVPFYVAFPMSTFDPATPDGAAITIEERAGAEVRQVAGQQTVPDAAEVFNPAFDVTPARLVTAYITEHGVFHDPQELQRSAPAPAAS